MWMRSTHDWQLAKSTIKIGGHHAKFKYIIHKIISKITITESIK
jgi:hypothetical protein